MVLELMQHTPRALPSQGCVAHELKFYPHLGPVRDEYYRSLYISSYIARKLVRYLNTYVEHGAFQFDGALPSSTSGVSYRGRRIITLRHHARFRVNLLVSLHHPHINEHIQAFLHAHYPIRQSVWMEVN